jgi:hypothetical protein
MNLAAALMAADARLGDIKNQIEAVLYSICPGWQSWEHLKPYGIEVFGALDSPRAAAVLFARGFVTVKLHDHRAHEQLITCRCPVHEIPAPPRRG